MKTLLQNTLILLVLFFSVSCSNGFDASKKIGINAIVESKTTTFPDSDKLDAGCMTNADFDGCVFNKNPVFQQRGALGSVDRTSLTSLQTFGFKLTGLNSSGFLENSHIKVMTRQGTRLNTNDPTALKVSVAKSNSTEFEQLMTYYYLERAIEYISSRGPLYVKGQNVQVFVDESFSGWLPESRSIFLQKTSGKWPAAFDASQIIYLLGLANSYYASGGTIDPAQGTDTTHVLCQSDAKGCCATANGCARALSSGVAAYFVAMMFPSAPVIGELSANRLAGVRLCQVVDRDLNAVANQTVQGAYAQCASRQGDVHILGSVYASIWWSLRQADPSRAYIVDHIYLQHLRLLQRTDTFLTAKTKILNVDQQLNGGRLKDRILAEFARRGL